MMVVGKTRYIVGTFHEAVPSSSAITIRVVLKNDYVPYDVKRSLFHCGGILLDLRHCAFDKKCRGVRRQFRRVSNKRDPGRAQVLLDLNINNKWIIFTFVIL